MASIIWSICAIGAVIGIGWLARRFDRVGQEAATSLAQVTYWVASPAMVFHAEAGTDVSSVFGRPLLVAAASGVGAALFFVAVARAWPRLRGPDLALGAMAASLNNGAYIGIPVAVYVLGDASAVLPVIVFQVGFFTPMFFVLAEVSAAGRTPSPCAVARLVVTNPIVVAAVAGLVFSATGAAMPVLVDVTASMLGQAAPPMILLAFGISLRGGGARVRGGAGAVLASATKLVVQPLVALSVGMALGLRGQALMSVTVMATLPTAQNAYIAATRAGGGVEIAQGTVLITTFASLPVTIGVAALFHALSAA